MWGLAALVVLGLLGTYEAYLRSIGLQPGVSSRQAVWVVSRYRVRPTSTVAVGSSRMLALVDPVVWAEAFGEEPLVQLATLGGASVPALEHLADDPTFRGRVLADVVPFFGFDTKWIRTALSDEIEAYQRSRISPAQRLEAQLRVFVPNLFSIRRQQARPRRLAEALWNGRPLPNPPGSMRTNGYGPLRFREVGIEANSARIMAPASFDHFRPSVPDEAAFDHMVTRLFNAVARIEARGGTVVLLYIPGCGGRRVMEEGHFPKERFWKGIEAQATFQTIDLDRYPDYSDFPCYDGSHLDVNDAVPVVRWLAQQIRSWPAG